MDNSWGGCGIHRDKRDLRGEGKELSAALGLLTRADYARERPLFSADLRAGRVFGWEDFCGAGLLVRADFMRGELKVWGGEGIMGASGASFLVAGSCGSAPRATGCERVHTLSRSPGAVLVRVWFPTEWAWARCFPTVLLGRGTRVLMLDRETFGWMLEERFFRKERAGNGA